VEVRVLSWAPNIKASTHVLAFFIAFLSPPRCGAKGAAAAAAKTRSQTTAASAFGDSENTGRMV